MRRDSSSYDKFQYSYGNALYQITSILSGNDGGVPAAMLKCINQKKVPELCVPLEHLDF